MSTQTKSRMNAGMDYSFGKSNFDAQTGFHFGVIHQNEVGEAWHETSEAFYGEPTCPKCGNTADEPDSFGETFADGKPDDYTDEKYEENEFVCVNCEHFFGTESAYGDEPHEFFVNDGEKLKASCGQDGDIFVFMSEFYTKSQWCSPCAPGAGYLMNPCDGGIESYCFGHDWFEGGKAPYPVYSVATGQLA